MAKIDCSRSSESATAVLPYPSLQATLRNDHEPFDDCPAADRFGTVRQFLHTADRMMAFCSARGILSAHGFGNSSPTFSWCSIAASCGLLSRRLATPRIVAGK
jgi:hypothetical protein